MHTHTQTDRGSGMVMYGCTANGFIVHVRTKLNAIDFMSGKFNFSIRIFTVANSRRFAIAGPYATTTPQATVNFILFYIPTIWQLLRNEWHSNVAQLPAPIVFAVAHENALHRWWTTVNCNRLKIHSNNAIYTHIVWVWYTYINVNLWKLWFDRACGCGLWPMAMTKAIQIHTFSSHTHTHTAAHNHTINRYWNRSVLFFLAHNRAQSTRLAVSMWMTSMPRAKDRI